MKTDRFFRKIHDIKRHEPSASSLAIGAMLVMTILYASTVM